jgi:hypothetical protein
MDIDGLLRAFTIFGILASLVALAVLAVRYAKRSTTGAGLLGAALLFFGFGNMRDPSNDVVQQAKESKKRQEGESGGPPAKD